jgi:hypothetical protein
MNNIRILPPIIIPLLIKHKVHMPQQLTEIPMTIHTEPRFPEMLANQAQIATTANVVLNGDIVELVIISYISRG